jgi:phosphopantetheinyl transferase (holo-ACP synthase)
MVGNDVVDLCCAETRPGATHPRFDARVFSPSEHVAVASSATPNRLRWILWAAKESTFKVVRRCNPFAAFSPRHFVVSLDGERRGTVYHRLEAFAISIDLNDAAVHVIATHACRVAAPVLSAVGRAGDADASAAARRLAIAALASWLAVKQDELEIVREQRIPHVRWRGQPLPVDLSLSHHGRFVAFACAGRRNPPLKKI